MVRKMATVNATDVIDDDKNQAEINRELSGNFSNIIVIHNNISDISDILNNAPSNTLIQIRDGNYIASGVKIEKNNILIQGQSIDGVKITVSADSSGIFMRFGKRGPSTDYHNDNLPQYNGTIDYWDELEYSPATTDYPRYTGIGIDSVTIILSNSNGIGGNTGLDFYRVNDPILNAKVRWTSKFVFGNGVRVHFCKNMRSELLEIDDNENSTYTMIYYWSYGLNADTWKIGKGNILSIDFKHSVNGYIKYLEASGRGAVGNSAINFGYGSINNTVDKILATNGDVTVKASVEFDVNRSVYFKELYINNPNAEGLTFIHATDVRVDKYFIRAKQPLNFTTSAFYVSSSARNLPMSQSTSEFSYDGNYVTTSVEAGFTKYYEKRPLPVLKDALFGKGKLVATTGAKQVIALTFAGSVIDLMDSTGKLRRFEDGNISARGYKEDFRTSFKYENSSPFSLDNVNFGEMTLIAEDEALNTIIAMAQFSAALDKCSGIFHTFANKKSWQHIWMFDSNVTIETNKFLTNPAGYVIEMDSMVRSKISGKLLANGRTVNFKGGSALYYKDGYSDHCLSGSIIRETSATASPPLVTNYSSSLDTWKPLHLENMRVYAEDGTTLLADHAILRHLGNLPAGIEDTNGGGYINKNCIIDRNTPFRRYFTHSNPDEKPPLKPNTVGEYAQNGMSDTWWHANSFSSWSKL